MSKARKLPPEFYARARSVPPPDTGALAAPSMPKPVISMIARSAMRMGTAPPRRIAEPRATASSRFQSFVWRSQALQTTAFSFTSRVGAASPSATNDPMVLRA